MEEPVSPDASGFVLELSATPADRPNDRPPIYSNWLVDVCGTALDKEGMIKLPINVTVRGDDDWRDCLRASFEHLNGLQAEADKLYAESARTIRLICLVQVEREQREVRYIRRAGIPADPGGARTADHHQDFGEE